MKGHSYQCSPAQRGGLGQWHQPRTTTGQKSHTCTQRHWIGAAGNVSRSLRVQVGTYQRGGPRPRRNDSRGNKTRFDTSRCTTKLFRIFWRKSGVSRLNRSQSDHESTEEETNSCVGMVSIEGIDRIGGRTYRRLSPQRYKCEHSNMKLTLQRTDTITSTLGQNWLIGRRHSEVTNPKKLWARDQWSGARELSLFFQVHGKKSGWERTRRDSKPIYLAGFPGTLSEGGKASTGKLGLETFA